MYVFHAAGGSTVVYEPLLNRLPAGTPMYGFERVEGTIEERAAQYVPKLLEMNHGKPFILAGWSLGGVLAYACAIGLKQAGADVQFVGLIDTRARRRGGPADQGGDPQALGPLRAVRREDVQRADPGDPLRAARGTRRRRSGPVRPRRRQAERRADSRRDHRAPADVVPGQPGLDTADDRALRRARHAVHGRPLPRRRDHVRARATPPASRTAAGASSCPTSRWCRSAASTSRPSTSRTSPRSVHT